MSYRKINERLSVSIENGTDRVPADGRYHVLVDNRIIYSTRVEAAAVAIYDELIAKRDEPFARIRENERAFSDFQSARRESVDRMRAATRNRGGPGGRGGV